MKIKFITWGFCASVAAFISWLFTNLVMGLPILIQALWSVGSMAAAIIFGIVLANLSEQEEREQSQRDMEEALALNGWNDREYGDMEWAANGM